MSTREAIAAFWAWWPGVSASIDEGIRRQGLSAELVESISEKVAAIDENLDWELGPGDKTTHLICLSGKGDPLLRVIAERWRHKAPEPDATWSYHAARQPHPTGGLKLEMGGHDIELDDVVITTEVEDAHEVVNIVAHHSVFASIDDDDLRWRVLMIALDTLLGEDDVERWLGGIEVSVEPLVDAKPIISLRETIKDLAAESTGDRWAVLKGTRDGAPLFVTANFAIKRIDHLLLDQHVAISIALLDPTDEGLTTQEEAEVLNTMEDTLFESLAEHAVHIGRETAGGNRTWHLHVMSEGPAAQLIDRWRNRYNKYKFVVEVRPDPRWDILKRWGL
jgi:hypothetical protein